MNLSPDEFRSILAELIDESPLACRGVLGLCALEFTTAIPTAQVTLGNPSTLRVNLKFVHEHCTTPAHVKALLLHEFLHVLLGHTRRFRFNSPARNFAADAVINALIHRQLGTAYSSFFTNYYSDKKLSPLLLLLSPPTLEDCDRLKNFEKGSLVDLRRRLQEGQVVLDDLLAFANELSTQSILRALESGQRVLLGHHGDDLLDGEFLPDWLLRKLDDAARQLSVPGGPLSIKGSSVDCPVPLVDDPALVAWDRIVALMLKRLVTPDPRSRATMERYRSVMLPVLHAGDRRASLRAQWSPFLPEATWSLRTKSPAGSTAVYLDVSGSMDAELKRIAPLLNRHRHWLRLPFWAFSNNVDPAEFKNGQLITRSTGGTSLDCVFEHIAITKPAKVLIITDGYVEEARGDWARLANQHGVEFLLSANGSRKRLSNLSRPITELISLPKAA